MSFADKMPSKQYSQTEKDKVIFNLEQVLKDCKEKREPSEVERQTKSVINLSNENIRNFKIVEDDSVKIPNANRTLRRYENPVNKWFCYYTDNLQELQISKQNLEMPELTILALHGGALDYKELTKLEYAFGEKTCRWINYAYPGYDGFDDNRGSFKGTVREQCQLIAELLDYLEIGQIIFLGHSFGGYYRNYFTLMYPQRVIGIASIATHSFEHNVGFRTWVECIERPLREYQITQPELLKMIQKKPEKKREVVKMIQDSFKYIRSNFGVQLAEIEENKILTQIRILMQQDYPLEIKETFKFLSPNIPHLITFGFDDPLIALDKQTETIFYLLNNTSRKQFELKRTPEVEKILEGIDFDYKKDVFYDNFLFMFEKCGHVPHLKRANELGYCLRLFARLINYLNTTNQLNYLSTQFPKL
ncbi:hypothetical protein ABPG72_008234 [Tetrahymena utriculariae]